MDVITKKLSGYLLLFIGKASEFYFISSVVFSLCNDLDESLKYLLFMSLLFGFVFLIVDVRKIRKYK